MIQEMSLVIEKLGGLYECQSPKIEEVDILKFESDINAKIPKDYEKFLLEYGYCIFNESISFHPIKNSSEYNHTECTGMMNHLFHGSQVGCFFGINLDAESSHNELIDIYRTYYGRMPENFLPIADDGLGNKICISLNDESFGYVYWWDHENEWDEDNYFDDVGKNMPNEVKYQNVYLISESFTEFLTKLKIQEE